MFVKVKWLPTIARKKRAAYNYDLWKKEKDSAKTVFDPRRLKHVKPLPKWGYIRRTAEEFFPDLKGLKRDVSTTFTISTLQ